jgi:hypothetical protein
MGPGARPKEHPAERVRDSNSSAYDRFWHCLSGRRPGERWPGGDVAPLANWTRAFGLAEDQKPLTFPPKTPTAQPGPDSAAGVPPAPPKRR